MRCTVGRGVGGDYIVLKVAWDWRRWLAAKLETSSSGLTPLADGEVVSPVVWALAMAEPAGPWSLGKAWLAMLLNFAK
jgi:hypothetical protein